MSNPTRTNALLGKQLLQLQDRKGEGIKGVRKSIERGILFPGRNVKCPHAVHKNTVLYYGWSLGYSLFSLVYHSHTECWWHPPVKRRIQLLGFRHLGRILEKNDGFFFFLLEPGPLKISLAGLHSSFLQKANKSRMGLLKHIFYFSSLRRNDFAYNHTLAGVFPWVNDLITTLCPWIFLMWRNKRQVRDSPEKIREVLMEFWLQTRETHTHTHTHTNILCTESPRGKPLKYSLSNISVHTDRPKAKRWGLDVLLESILSRPSAGCR